MSINNSKTIVAGIGTASCPLLIEFNKANIDYCAYEAGKPSHASWGGDLVAFTVKKKSPEGCIVNEKEYLTYYDVPLYWRLVSDPLAPWAKENLFQFDFVGKMRDVTTARLLGGSITHANGLYVAPSRAWISRTYLNESEFEDCLIKVKQMVQPEKHNTKPFMDMIYNTKVHEVLQAKGVKWRQDHFDIESRGEEHRTMSAGPIYYWVKDGIKRTTLNSFLTPEKLKSYTTEMEVLSIKFAPRQSDNSITATSVKVKDKEGKTFEVSCANVVLTAGALMTPVILQRSGIGPVDILKRANIDVLIPNEFIGRVEDHITFDVAIKIKNHNHDTPSILNGFFKHTKNYIENRTGLFASTGHPLISFVKTPSGIVMVTFIAINEREHYLQLGIWAVDTRSYRKVAINEASPESRPKISDIIIDNFNDIGAIVFATKKMLQIFNDPVLQEHYGEPCVITHYGKYDPFPANWTDEWLSQKVQENLKGNNHYQHSVPLGHAVDTETFLLKGTTNVFVADLSVLPLCDGPTAAAAAALGMYAGAKISRIIKSRESVPVSKL